MTQTSEQRIRIFHIIGGLGSGGTERQLYLAIKYLDPARFEHHILVLNPNQNLLNPDLEDLGAHIWPIPAGQRSRWSRLLYIVRLAGFLKPQVIHSWTFYANLYAGLGGLLANVRLRVGSHRSADVHYAFLSAGYKKITAGTLHRMVVNSRATFAQLQQDGYLPGRLDYIPNMVEYPLSSSYDARLDLPGLRADARWIGTVGNLRRLKNHAMFIEGLSRLIGRWNIQGVIIGQTVQGEPEVLPSILQKIQDLRAQEHIHYGGHRADIPSLMRQFNIFCLTSDYEGMPNVILEAMAAGKPIVATRVGDVPDVVRDGVNGFLVDSGDVDAFTSAVERLLQDPLMAKKMGEAGQKIVQYQYAPETALKSLASIYQLKGSH